MGFLKVICSLVLIWALALLTLAVLRTWGPIDAFVKHAAEGNVIVASGILAAFVIIVLLLLYVFGKLVQWVGVAKNLAQHLSRSVLDILLFRAP